MTLEERIAAKPENAKRLRAAMERIARLVPGRSVPDLHGYTQIRHVLLCERGCVSVEALEAIADTIESQAQAVSAERARCVEVLERRYAARLRTRRINPNAADAAGAELAAAIDEIKEPTK